MGAVAGHVAGHHAVAGAAAGCVVFLGYGTERRVDVATPRTPHSSARGGAPVFFSLPAIEA